MWTGLDMPIDFENEEQKKFLRDSIKAGIDSWLESKMAQVGKWTLRGMCAAALAALAHFITQNGGWHK
jgi:hypothetical protein